MSTLVVVCGLPGSGKTTHARSVARRLDAVRLSADDELDRLGVDLWDADLRAVVEQAQALLVEPLLERGRSVVVEWGSWSRVEREALRVLGRAAGASVELHHVTAPVDELHRRVAARGRETPAITLEQLIAWEKAFEPIGDEESGAWDHVVVVPTGGTRPHHAAWDVTS